LRGEKKSLNMPNKWVYLFSEVDQAEEYVGGEWGKVRGLLGGKGANLAEMTRIEVPVPPGFTITTEATLENFEILRKIFRNFSI
jgi:hypothetical protein